MIDNVLSPTGFDINFFLVGFPKCGTTSVAKWLSSHQDIEFSKPKEPGYFCSEFPGKQNVVEPEEYRSCWSNIEKGKVLGEGTVIYIYSQAAIEKILSFYPEAKFIVMVRRPADLVRSLHSNNLRSFQEDIATLEEAWLAQEQRATGEKIPPKCSEPFFLQYREVARQGKYLKQLTELCDRSRIHVIFFDDLIDDSKKEYRRLVSFLGLDLGDYPDFRPVNVQRSFKLGMWPDIGRRMLGVFQSLTLKKLRRLIPVKSLGIHRLIYESATQENLDKSMPAELRRAITSELEEDVNILRELTGNALVDW